MRSPAVTARLHGEQIEYRNFPLDRLDAQLTYEAKRLYVLKRSLPGSLTVDPENPPFGLELTAGNNCLYRRGTGPAGHITGAVSGCITRHMGVRVDSARLEVTASGRSITLSRLDVHRDSLLFSARGAYNIHDARGSFTANVLTGEGPYQTGRSSEAEAGLVEASFAMPTPKQMQVSASGRGLDLRTIASMILDTARVSGLLDFEMKGGGLGTLQVASGCR